MHALHCIKGITVLSITIFGAPTRGREQMARLLEVSGCNYVLCAFAWGPFPHAQTLRSLRLFAEEVMPAFS